MSELDPELVNDKFDSEDDAAPVDLPEYDPEQFNLEDNFEWTEEEEEGDDLDAN